MTAFVGVDLVQPYTQFSHCS